MLKYTPQKIDESTYSFALIVKKCPVCGKLMMSQRGCGAIPVYVNNTLEAQCERAGIVAQSYSKLRGKKADPALGSNDYICVECEAADKAFFTCAICGEDKPSSKCVERIGAYMPDSLCSDCYSSVSARKWNEEIDRLERKHQYDNC